MSPWGPFFQNHKYSVLLPIFFEIVDGRTDDGQTPDHGHTISSSCEPNGSGELKIDFSSNLTLIDLVSSVCQGGSVRLYARHQAYIADTVK